jgi:hypothetical protein
MLLEELSMLQMDKQMGFGEKHTVTSSGDL